MLAVVPVAAILPAEKVAAFFVVGPADDLVDPPGQRVVGDASRAVAENDAGLAGELVARREELFIWASRWAWAISLNLSSICSL